VRSHFDLTGDFHAAGGQLEVYDLTGRRVVSLKRSSGTILSWDLRGAGGERVARGVYFFRAVSGRETVAGKLVILE